MIQNICQMTASAVGAGIHSFNEIIHRILIKLVGDMRIVVSKIIFEVLSSLWFIPQLFVVNLRMYILSLCSPHRKRLYDFKSNRSMFSARCSRCFKWIFTIYTLQYLQYLFDCVLCHNLNSMFTNDKKWPNLKCQLRRLY